MRRVGFLRQASSAFRHCGIITNQWQPSTRLTTMMMNSTLYVQVLM
jgi:hypothetical protein